MSCSFSGAEHCNRAIVPCVTLSPWRQAAWTNRMTRLDPQGRSGGAPTTDETEDSRALMMSE
jgi:hypothetical protein